MERTRRSISVFGGAESKMNWKSLGGLLAGLLLGAAAARGDIALLLEEPFGAFGGMNPTGHAAIYLSRVCADSPLSLRRCGEGEQGVVISRYHRIAGFDWIAIPVIPYLYAVNREEQVPKEVGGKEVTSLRDDYRRRYLEQLAPDNLDGGAPAGDWIQLVGAAYDRTIYAFGIQTTAEQDDKLIETFNSRPNDVQFHLLFRNCADFARNVIDFYYPRAVHRSLISDVGIMTPKQAAKSLVHYGLKHPSLQVSSFVIAQVAGTVPRSTPVRGVLESLMRSKKYSLPMASLAVLHPYFAGGVAFAWVEGSHFDPRRVAGASDGRVQPASVARRLQFVGDSEVTQ
jgi:hypothetical protein